MGASVDWDFARRVAGRVSNDDDFSSGFQYETLEVDLLELTTQAERLVESETGLISAAGPARARVTDRMGWVDANLASFERLMRPLFGRMEQVEAEKTANGTGRSLDLPGPLVELGKTVGAAGNKVGQKVAGAELGALLGWMSSRVLGQYDLLIAEDDNPNDQDWVYYVAPNILALEKRYGFPPREFRLWIAVHECTHRAQFTGVPWLREYFLSLVNELLDSVDPDPKNFADTIGQALKDARSGDGPSLSDGGLSALLASPEQRETMNKVSGLMSLLEGHGDLTMDRATTTDLIPSKQRFARVMSHRRQNSNGIAKLVQRLTGMEAKLAQYAEGEDFVRAVESAGGCELFDQVWASPEMLPNLDEIRQPSLWVSRVGQPAGA